MEQANNSLQVADNSRLTVEDFSHVTGARGHIASFNQDILKALVHTPDFFDHGSDKRYQRFAAQGRADIAKRYLACDAHLRIGVVWGDAPIREQVGKHYALIKIPGAADNDTSVCTCDTIMAQKTKVSGSANCDQFHMLVNVCHSENISENLISSIVRLCAEDGFSQIAVEMA
jgi:hypothetical protein